MSNNAIDDVTDSIVKATISDNTTEKANGSHNDVAGTASAAEGRRLYVGNLPYATTEGELKDFFSRFTIEHVSIPTHPRNGRPVGYAFVDLATQVEAEQAIDDLSGKEILQRRVSVQQARKNDGSQEKGENAVNGGETGSGGEGERRRFGGRGRGRGRGRPRGARGYRGSRNRAGEDGGHEGDEAATNLPDHVLPLTENTNPTTATKDGSGEQPADNAGKTGKPRGQREPKQRGPPEDGIESKTKVMVANLPYDYSEEKLKELFADYEPGVAKIALRPIPRFMVKKLQARNEPRKGRGFGFITLGSEEMQQKAINEMNGKEVEGRVIAVKVAVDSPGKEDDDANVAGTTEQPETEATEQPAAA